MSISSSELVETLELRLPVVDRAPCRAGASPMCVQKGMLAGSIWSWPQQLATGRGRVFTARRRPALYPYVRRFAAGTFACGPCPEARRRCQRCNLNICRNGPTSCREGRLASKAAPALTLAACARVPCFPGAQHAGDKARYLIATSRLLRSN